MKLREQNGLGSIDVTILASMGHLDALNTSIALNPVQLHHTRGKRSYGRSWSLGAVEANDWGTTWGFDPSPWASSALEKRPTARAGHLLQA